MSNIIELYSDQILDLVGQVESKGYEFSEVISELQSIDLKLLDHPDEDLFGFNELYAEVQSYISRVTSIILSLREEKQVWLTFKYQADKLFSKMRYNLLSTRDDIKMLKSQELREASIFTELSQVIDIQSIIERSLSDLDYLVKQCEIKRDDLDKANTNMSRQQRVIESMIGLGMLSKQV